MTTQVQPYQERAPFEPREHLMQIPNKGGKTDYLPVQWRLVWFREQCPDGVIETEMVLLDLDRETEEEGYAWNQETRRSEKIMKRANGLAIFRATVRDGKGGIATGTKSEKAASFADFIEKAETGAIGRALAALGYGTQFAPELNEEHRIVDAPVERTEDDRRTYTERRPFVEGTVASNQQQTNAQRFTPPPVAKEEHISVGSLFERGKALKLWTTGDEFYKWLDEKFGKQFNKFITRETVRDLSQTELAEVSKQLYEQVPATVSGAH